MEGKKQKYVQVADELRKEIEEGKLSVGERFYTEYELTERFNVSRYTVRKAIELLQDEGQLRSKQGSGTYVGGAGFRSGKYPSKTIGVISTNVSDYIFPTVIRGIEKELSIAGYRVQLAVTEINQESEGKVLKRLLEEESVDGIMIDGTKTALPSPNIPLYRELINKGVPLVFLYSTYYDLRDQIVVGMDDLRGGVEAIDYLVSRGHKKIAGIFRVDDIVGVQRYAGYHQGLMKHGIPLDDIRVKLYTTEESIYRKNHENEEYIRDWMVEFLADATAAVCHNDETAVWLMRILESVGRRVPDDFTLVGFDQSIYYEMFQNKIVSFGHQKERMGKIAARKMLQLLAGERAEAVYLPWDSPLM